MLDNRIASRALAGMVTFSYSMLWGVSFSVCCFFLLHLLNRLSFLILSAAGTAKPDGAYVSPPAQRDADVVESGKGDSPGSAAADPLTSGATALRVLESDNMLLQECCRVLVPGCEVERILSRVRDRFCTTDLFAFVVRVCVSAPMLSPFSLVSLCYRIEV